MFIWRSKLYQKYFWNLLSEGKGFALASLTHKLFTKSLTKNFISLGTCQEVEPPGSTSLQERIALRSIKVVF
jgi:hypothetical protein